MQNDQAQNFFNEVKNIRDLTLEINGFNVHDGARHIREFRTTSENEAESKISKLVDQAYKLCTQISELEVECSDDVVEQLVKSAVSTLNTINDIKLVFGVDYELTTNNNKSKYTRSMYNLVGDFYNKSNYVSYKGNLVGNLLLIIEEFEYNYDNENAWMSSSC